MNKYERQCLGCADIMCRGAERYCHIGDTAAVIEYLTWAVVYLGLAGYGAEECEDCEGSGRVSFIKTAPDGWDEIRYGDCPTCHGHGIVPQG